MVLMVESRYFSLCAAVLLAVCFGATCAASFANPGQALPVESGRQQLDRMLSQLGGRDRWASIKTITNDSQQFRIQGPVEVRAVIKMDFQSPRWRIDSTAPGLSIVRVVSPASQWRRNRQGHIENLPADTLEGDKRWYRSHVYRTIHRLAAQDAALSVTIGPDGRLDVFERGERIAWFKLNQDGEPYRFGAGDDDAGSISGPWRMTDQGIKHPIWVSSADGTWRSMLNGIRINETYSDADFDRPVAK